MKAVLGIDQGSTHTRAAVADLRGNLLAVGWAAGACHADVGMQRAMDGVLAAANQALAGAGLDRGDLACLFAGMTGADWADEYGLLKDNLLRLGLCPNVTVTNDSIIALRGGTDRPYGAILIAGSGGNCAVRAPDGREYIYGYFLDDDLQGGGALARRALVAVYRSYTGRAAATRLTEHALSVMGVPTVEDLRRADVEDRLEEARLHALVPLVFEANCEGDVVAGQVLRAFGHGYADLVIAGMRRFEMTGLALEVVLSGSVFKGKGGLLQAVIAADLALAAPRAALVDARYEPVVGAVLLGLEQMGVAVTDAIQDNVEASAVRLGLIRNSTS